MAQFENLINKLSSSRKRLCGEDEEQEKIGLKRTKMDGEAEKNIPDSSSSSENEEHFNVVVEKKKKFTLTKRPLVIKGRTPLQVVYDIDSSNTPNAFSYSSEMVNRQKFRILLRKGEDGGTSNETVSARKFAETYKDILQFGDNTRANTSSSEDGPINVTCTSSDDSTSDYKSTNSVICISDDEVSSTSTINSKNCEALSANTPEEGEYIDVENNTGPSSSDNEVTDICMDVISSSVSIDLQNSETEVVDINSEDDRDVNTAEPSTPSSPKSDVDGAQTSADTKIIADKIEPNEKCPICMTAFCVQQKIASPQHCNHLYCISCICQWAEKNNVCPVDRIPFDAVIVKTYGSDEVVTKLFPFRLDTK